MYYEEKMIDGVLCWRGDPEGEFTPYTVEQLSRKYEQEKEQTSCLRELEEDLRTQLSYEINKSDNLIQEARIWKQEAQTQTATITEIYNLVGQGDTKDYLGAAPVREYVERTEREVSELRAQLARCVEHYDDRTNLLREALESIARYCKEGKNGPFDACEHAMCISADALETDDNYDEEYLIEGSIEKFKADAEVLRCAEEESKNHNLKLDGRYRCTCVLCNAVRAARDANNE